MIDDAVFAELGELKPRLETLYKVLEPEGKLGDLPGWLEFVHRPAGLLRVNGLPVLVATLYGPSGAGKSTFFRLLTGIQVPAGAERRPTTYGCIVAIPEAVKNDIDLAATFPGYTEVLHLDSPTQLADAELPAGRLYWDAYPSPPPNPDGEACVALIADVPDINTYEKRNWQRAEEMLARSEVCVFVSGPESYSDERILKQFRHAIEVAGRIAYLFTKCTRREAELKWEHLRELLQGEDLSNVDIFHSEFSREPTLEGVTPLFSETPLPDVIRGGDALAIRLATMTKEARAAAGSLLDVGERAVIRQRDTAQRIKRVEEACAIEAERIATVRAPVKEVLEMILEKAEYKRPDIANKVLGPLRFVSKGTRSAIRLVKTQVFGKDTTNADELERAKVAKAANNLVELLRVIDKEAVPAARADEALKTFLARDLPQPTKGWQESFEDEAEEWIDANPAKVQTIAIMYDALCAGAPILVAADLAIGGIGSLSIAGLASSGALLGGSEIVELLNKKLGLGAVLDAAREAWMETRKSELAQHLQTHLCDPLLSASLHQTHETLLAAKPEELRDRARALQQRVRES